MRLLRQENSPRRRVSHRRGPCHSGCGGETSQYAVITNDEVPYPLKRDVIYTNQELIRPRFAILDPELTLDLPSLQTACGIVDIMAHVIERYSTCTPNVDFTDRLCEARDRSPQAIEHELSAL